MLPIVLGGLDWLVDEGADAVRAAAGWAWDKVTSGIYSWLLDGLVVLMEWVWGVLDTASTPRVTEEWFRDDIAGHITVLALAVTVAMMLASAAQAALAGRPEQIGDTVKEGARAAVASALTISVIDVMIGVVDEASALVWETGRPDLVTMMENLVAVATASGPVIASAFIAPLVLLMGLLGLVGLAISLMMRNALIYVVAALAPLVWSSSVLPLLRGSSRRMVQLLVALIVSKLAIVVTLVIAVKLLANVGGDPASEEVVEDATAAIGVLLTGFTCFLVAAVSPFVLYKLMPTVEGAAASSGIAGGWGRGMVTSGQAALMAHSGATIAGAGRSAAGGAATQAVAGQGGVEGMQGALTTTGGTDPSGNDPSAHAGEGRAAGAAAGPAGGGSTGSDGGSQDDERPRASAAAGSGEPAGGSPAGESTASGSPTSGSPTSGSPTSGSPTSGSPTSGSPTSGSPASGEGGGAHSAAEPAGPAAGSEPARRPPAPVDTGRTGERGGGRGGDAT